MSRILLFNISGEKEAKIKLLCRKLYLDIRSVGSEYHATALGAILEDSIPEPAINTIGFDEEMLYMHDLPQGMLGILLDQMRRRGLTVSLKAISTQTNLAFTPCELYRELSAEREAIRRGATAHE